MRAEKWSGHLWLLYAAWLVSVIATLGSLYFSEIMHFIPCELCWYQRILMYPLTILLGFAAYFGEFQIRKYVLSMAIIGVSFSVHHYLLQKWPGYGGFMTCSQGIPCNQDYIDWFGFVTIPLLAMAAFLLIIGMISWSLIKERFERKADTE